MHLSDLEVAKQRQGLAAGLKQNITELLNELSSLNCLESALFRSSSSEKASIPAHSEIGSSSSPGTSSN